MGNLGVSLVATGGDVGVTGAVGSSDGTIVISGDAGDIVWDGVWPFWV